MTKIIIYGTEECVRQDTEVAWCIVGEKVYCKLGENVTD